MKDIGIYIHIPFCASKCLYCDFNSRAGMEAFIPEYFEALYKEIEKCDTKADVTSVFIGGGTPSLPDSRYIGETMELISKKFSIKKDAEITIESNPGTLNIEKLCAYRSYGINRLSMGLQSTKDELLRTIGRCHSYDDFKKNYNEALKAGFSNINADLIFSLPNQTLEDWDASLKNLIEMGLQHISCYSLKVEEGTPFHKLYEEGKLNIPSEEADREMYQQAKNILHQNGYVHYEISNFSKPGLECRHNILYWKAKEYIGFGAGAHSYLNDYRYSNKASIKDYISDINQGTYILQDKDFISKDESMSEYVILGLRLIEGLDTQDFYNRYGLELQEVYGDKIGKQLKLGLIEVNGHYIRLTEKGLDLANQVMMEFI